MGFVITNTNELFSYRNESGVNKAVIPDGVITLGNNSFSGTTIESVTIPDSVVKIGFYTFFDCEKLLSATIPDSVTEIGSSAFYMCLNLKSVRLPDGIKIINSNTFGYCKKLESINIPEGVTEIGNNAFEKCESLTSIIIPEGVTKIGNDAFRECKKLKSVTIPNSVKEIGAFAFMSCHELESVSIPSNVRKIGEAAFAYCEKLTSVEISNGVQRIDNGAFSECKNLKNIYIPDSVKKIGSGAFNGCEKLETIELSEKNRYFSFAGGILYDKNLTKLIEAVSPPEIIVIPDSVTELDEDSLSSCKYEKIIIRNNELDWNYHYNINEIFDMIVNDEFVYFDGDSYFGRFLCDFFCRDYESENFKACFKKNFANIFNDAINTENTVFINKVIKSKKYLTKSNIDKFIEYASLKNKSEISEILIAYKNEHFQH